MKPGKRLRPLIAAVLVLCLALALPAAALAQDDILSEVRDLLETKYVDPVPQEVLKAASVEEMLEKLGDKHTQYMTREEYEEFLNTLDRTFSGIGIYLEMVPQGVMVLDAIEGLPSAKAGIKAGDIIIEADGSSLAGKTSEYAVSKLRGPEGSTVKVKVKRGDKILDFVLKREKIEFPLVSGKVLEGHIGYVAVYSFGQETVSQFDKEVKALKEKGVDSWIIDLRNNGGGYTQAALDLLGFFIGNEYAVILKDRSILSIVYRATKQAYTLDQPIVFLTNNYTGSSSEIVTAAVKDHNKATIIGETTIGSGRVKALIPLSNGDYLKMTIKRFYSPDNHPIDEVGIKPHVDLSGVDELRAAVLMLKNYGRDDSGDKSGYVQLSAGPNKYVISLEDMRKPEYWQAGQKLLDSVFWTTTMKVGGVNGWEPLPENLLRERHKLYYPGYIEAGNLQGIPLDKKFTVTFTKDMDWNTVTPGTVELIDTATGERAECKLTFMDSRKMIVFPVKQLKPDREYWLVIHSSIKDAGGKNIAGGVALAKTVK